MSVEETTVASNYFVGMCCEGGARFVAVDAMEPALEMKRRHKLMGNASVLAAESLVMAALLSAHVKGDERLTLQVFAEDPQFNFSADVNGDGSVRGRFFPQRMVPGKSFRGTITVLKSLWQQELYRSLADVQDETIEQALSRYLRTSQQTDARVYVLAERDLKNNLVFAAGLLVERLPHMDAEDFAARMDVEGAVDLKALMMGLEGQIGGDARIGGDLEIMGAQTLHYACSCSAERVRGILRAMGHEEVRLLLEEQGKAEVNCHFCNTDYVVEKPELEQILAELAAERPAGEA